MGPHCRLSPSRPFTTLHQGRGDRSGFFYSLTENEGQRPGKDGEEGGGVARSKHWAL